MSISIWLWYRPEHTNLYGKAVWQLRTGIYYNSTKDLISTDKFIFVRLGCVQCGYYGKYKDLIIVY